MMPTVGLSLWPPLAATGDGFCWSHRSTFLLGRNEMVDGVCFLIRMVFELPRASQQSFEFPLGEQRNYNFHLFWHFCLSSTVSLNVLLINKSYWKPWGWWKPSILRVSTFIEEIVANLAVIQLSILYLVLFVAQLLVNLAKSHLLRFSWG